MLRQDDHSLGHSRVENPWAHEAAILHGENRRWASEPAAIGCHSNGIQHEQKMAWIGNRPEHVDLPKNLELGGRNIVPSEQRLIRGKSLPSVRLGVFDGRLIFLGKLARLGMYHEQQLAPIQPERIGEASQESERGVALFTLDIGDVASLNPHHRSEVALGKFQRVTRFSD